MSKINKKLLIMITFLIIVIIIIFLLLNIFGNNTIKDENPPSEIGNVVYEKGPADLDENSIIGKNKCNEFEFITVTEEELVTKYLEDYKKNALNYPENAYDSLDVSYRNKKFGNIENYEQYIQENKAIIKNLQLTKYLINSYDNYEEYICIDQYNNYYIFHVTSVMKYTLLLDTYTTDLPEFTEKYNKANEQQRVALNINKVFSAINAKDYKYVYSKLADSFKSNYFESEEKLKDYLTDKLFEKNTVNYKTFSQEGTNIYTYQIELSDSSTSEVKEGKGVQLGRIKMNIVMQLNEGTDFVMSFSVEE